MPEQLMTEPPRLQPPGMGLPKFELVVAQILVRFKLWTTSQAGATKAFVEEAQRILAIAAQIDPVDASQRILIDRLPGLEDSSRYWSVYMTIEHLCIVNRFTIDVVKSLMNGKRLDIVASTAAVKPSEEAGEGVVVKFRSICEEFQESFPPHKMLTSTSEFAHPWFGKLNAQQWHFFAGFHMQLHRRQISKIVTKLSGKA